MAKQVWKPGTLVAPIPPMLVSCGSLEHPNILTAAWCGNTNSIPPKAYVSIRPERYSYNLIKESGEFVLNLTTEKLLRAADWCGVKSGRDYQKFEEMKLTPEACSQIGAPQIAECPITLECKVCQIIPLGSHDMFLADIVAVNVDDSLLDTTGSLHMERAGLVAYAHGQYFALGRSLGHFGFSVKKKSTQKKETAAKNETRQKSSAARQEKPAETRSPREFDRAAAHKATEGRRQAPGGGNRSAGGERRSAQGRKPGGSAGKKSGVYRKTEKK